jgi:hypothetical protein
MLKDLQHVYGVDASPTMISKMTDRILPMPKNGKIAHRLKSTQLYLWMRFIAEWLD